MSTKIGSLAVSLSLDAENWNGSMAQVDRSLRTMGSELKATKAMGTDYGKSLDGLKSKKDILTRSIEASSIKLTEERRKYDELVASGKASEAQLERQAKKVNDAQVQYNRLSAELSEVDKALKTQSSSWTQLGERLTATGTKMKAVGDGMKNIGRDLTMKVTAPLAALGTGAFKAAVDFESAFAGVRKTVDMTESEFAILSGGIREMAKEIPAAATEIAGVAEAAGQLGVQNDAILGFTRTMVDMGVATDMSSDSAAMALARLATITQMNQKDFDRLGATIVGLGNNLAATESEIVEMGLRLAGAGNVIGMTEAQILGFSGALAAVGINAEAGGSAFSKLFIEAANLAANGGEGLRDFAKVAGMSAKEFQKAFEEDAASAIISFIEGLGRINEAGGNVFGVLDDLGLSEIRLRDALLRSAGAGDVLRESIELGTKSWEENIALTNEAEERYKTTASQMKIMWNRITDIGISIGGILIPKVTALMDKIDPLIDSFANMSDETQNTILILGGVAAAIGPVLVAGGALVSGIGGLITVAGAASTALGVSGVGLGATVLGIAGPIGIGVGAIAGLSAAGYGLYQVLNQTAIPEIDIFGDKVSENTKQAVGGFVELTNEATVQLNQLKWSGKAVTEEMAEEMIETYGQMGSSILEKTQESHATQLETARNFFATTKSMTKEEQEKLLSTIEEGQQRQIERYESIQERYSAILESAATERRNLTIEERAILEQLQQEMHDTGIRILSETEEESLIILERLKRESEKITAEQAIETADRAREAKEAVIEEAEQKYEEYMAIALMLKQDGSKEALEAAENIIEEAERTRDNTIKAAEHQYEEVIRIAKEKGGDYVTETELHLGRAMTEWEKMAHFTIVETTSMGIKVKHSMTDMAVNGAVQFKSLHDKGITAIGNLVTGVKLVDTIPGIVKKAVEDAAREAAKSAAEFYKAGKDVIQGLIDGMKTKTKEVILDTYKLGKNMVTAISSAIGRQSPAKEFIKVSEDAGEGLIVGWKNVGGKVVAASADVGSKMVTALRDVIYEENKKIDATVIEVNKKAAAERTKLEKELSQSVASLRDKSNQQLVELERKTTQQINTIHQNAKAKKRGITSAETTRIQNIEADAASKRLQINRKLGEDIEKATKSNADKIKKINETAAKETAKINENVYSERLKTIKAFVEEKKTMEQLSIVEEAKIWEAATKLFLDGTKEKIEAQKAYRNAVEAINKEITSINSEFEGQMKTINDNLVKQIDDLNKAYDDAVSGRTQSLQSFKGIFEEFNWTVEESGQDLLQNLHSQVEGFELWQSQMEKFASKAVDQGLIAELRQMGPKALPELLALNSLTDEQLTQYSALYQEKMQLAREQAEAELVGMKKDTEQRIDDLRRAANHELEIVRAEWVVSIRKIVQASDNELKALETTGRQAGEGLLRGLESMEPALIAKARSIAQAIRDEIDRVLEIASPSKATFRSGAWAGDGLIGGMDDKLQAIKKKAAEMARMAIPKIPEMNFPLLQGVHGGQIDNTRMTDNSRSMVNHITVKTTDSNVVSEVDRLFRRYAFKF